MTPRILIAGSGKMARDIGGLFLRCGCSVRWTVRDDEGRLNLDRALRRDLRRLARVVPELGAAPTPSISLYEDPVDTAPHAFIEAVTESVIAKQDVFLHFAPRLPDQTLLLSNSSSILPATLHPRCLGLHLFYPAALTRVAEVVVTGDKRAPAELSALEALTERAGLHVFRQDERNAFAVNRLLLPLQAACMHALTTGADAAMVDAASASELMPVGQLSLMDAVGLDVIAPAVDHYVSRMEPRDAADYAVLRNGLAQLLAQGKRGRKNGDGFLVGAPLPWPTRGTEPAAPEPSKKFLYLLINSCYGFLGSMQMSRQELDMALDAVFQAELTLAQVVEREGLPAIRAGLTDWAATETSASWLIPASGLMETR